MLKLCVIVVAVCLLIITGLAILDSPSVNFAWERYQEERAKRQEERAKRKEEAFCGVVKYMKEAEAIFGKYRIDKCWQR